MYCSFIPNKKKVDCCGCEACSMVCPPHIIKMQEDSEGFVYPHIDNLDLCINCKKCERVCPVTNPTILDDKIIEFNSGHLKLDEDIRKSASGGLATSISRNFILKYHGVVYGVAYSADCKSVRYERAETIEQLEKFRGSKYAQSRKTDICESVYSEYLGGEIYKKVIKDLKAGLYVLFIGLPCEVAALNNISRKKYEKLFTMELVCHGPTSQKVHREYVEHLEKVNGKIIDFTVRYKHDGWKPYYIKAVFDSNLKQTPSTFIEVFHPSSYGIAFSFLKRPSCKKCNFKLGNRKAGLQADITIGDFHYISSKWDAWNKWGSSVAYIHSCKGQELCTLSEKSFDFFETQPRAALKSSKALSSVIKPRLIRNWFSYVFRKKGLYAASQMQSVAISNYIVSFRSFLLGNIVKLRNVIMKCMRN